MAATHHRVAVHDPQELIGRFISIDRLGAAIGFVFVVVANGLFVQVAAVWWTLPFLACVIVALTVADRYLERGRLARSLAAIAIGNWVVAIAIAALLPFLWPVMVLTAIMPLLLATPFLESRQLIVLTSTAAFVGGLVAIIGLLSDDSGVLPDIDDVYELVLVTGAATRCRWRSSSDSRSRSSPQRWRRRSVSTTSCVRRRWRSPPRGAASSRRATMSGVGSNVTSTTVPSNG
jgi:hypothetical protein